MQSRFSPDWRAWEAHFLGKICLHCDYLVFRQMQDGKYVISKSYMSLWLFMPNVLDLFFQDKKLGILYMTSANMSMVCVQNNGDSYFFGFQTHFWARIIVFNQHGTQTIASQPSQFTWYIHKMILDGWEGDPWARSLASDWFGCVKHHFCARIKVSNQQWHPNHCFSTIPIHLIHPQNDLYRFLSCIIMMRDGKYVMRAR
jgi:hypothetical protein